MNSKATVEIDDSPPSRSDHQRAPVHRSHPAPRKSPQACVAASRTDTPRRLTPAGRFLRAASLMTTVLCLSLTATACDDASTATSPSDTSSTTPTVATPTITELFAGRVNVSGSAFYSFSVVENGTVNVTLAEVGGAGVPSTVWLGLGIGTPSGEDCFTTATVNTAAGAAVHLTGTYAPGVYCVRVWDIGNLAAVAAFNVTVAHP